MKKLQRHHHFFFLNNSKKYLFNSNYYRTRYLSHWLYQTYEIKINYYLQTVLERGCDWINFFNQKGSIKKGLLASINIYYSIIRILKEAVICKYPYPLFFALNALVIFAKSAKNTTHWKFTAVLLWKIRSHFVHKIIKKITCMDRYPRY